MQTIVANNYFKFITGIGVGIPIFIILLLSMMILPLPPILLDIFFTFNITLSLIVLLACTYALRPLDFSIFPTVLLVATLLRLALNIASTRVVLLEGHTGTDAVGKVIEAFGHVVIGGNYAVGIVIFMIILIINFVVITKGGGRISEVSARFTLDSMPGKQMAIDADLNAGIINQEQAKARRDEVAREADFYGSMDGASKFVRGDAIAGVLILIINLLGGFAIGILQHDLSMSESARIYTLLTIGDGLVAQVPSILLSTAAAIMVTRVSASHDVGDLVKIQVFSHYKPLMISAVVMFMLGIIPGMPHFVFITVAGLLGGAAYYLYQKTLEKEVGQEEGITLSEKEDKKAEPKEVSWDDVQSVDPVSLEVGYKLISLVDEKTGGELMQKIKGVRRKLSQELGFLVPSVHIRDDLALQPSQYRISLMGVVMGEFQVHMDKALAISSGKIFGKVDGIDCKDPAFGLDAVWINPSLKEQAQTKGYTVVDTATVIATHLSQIVQDHAYELLGHDEAQKIIDRLAKQSPKLVEDLIPEKLNLSALVKILQNLLREHVPIRDSKTIVETLSSYASKSQDPAILTEQVRVKLGRMIVQQLIGPASQMPVITLDSKLEQILQQGIQSGKENPVIEPMLLNQVQKKLVEFSRKQIAMGNPVILLAANELRPVLSKLLRPSIKELSVLSFNEIPDDKQINVISTLGNS
ncbi:flagellar biosynthesis protein FlhA [Candidatus Berkiella cookevillensis]|uniref:Flagellar biosynthesis protein FlhA n=1 Tax=Candidatus Berkiella cookevillensis TaxID=437022 RepID=A0A0Q9YSI7_9GAMM|nr:flagellar biosynthesis protein FlhA [Candidatus Berkiella cookevillensis]MCS5708596.1 flagellar biosynthesis protein FlhA [Candidatus Berkiella cookevillensis]